MNRFVGEERDISIVEHEPAPKNGAGGSGRTPVRKSPGRACAIRPGAI